MIFKNTARFFLHGLGGLTLLRWKHRSEFGIPMFHFFSCSTRSNMEAICQHLTRHFEPVSLSQVAGALEKHVNLPENAVAVTIDDGYKSFLEEGHSVFKKYCIPTTIYLVSGFTDGCFWLWFDRIEFVLERTSLKFLHLTLNGKEFELQLYSDQKKAAAHTKLLEALKGVPNEERVKFVDSFGPLCGVDVPSEPPASRAAMSWDEVRAVSAEGVDIGCHTHSHPILSRISDPRDVEQEIGGSKRLMEERLGRPIRHFCYPNGRDEDISDLAVQTVVSAGFATATTASWGLNTPHANPVRLRRIPLELDLGYQYGVELLAGLHM
jgi:peptidoglycan/xylan/chitin deacetylase (PgdA/CDA1 family)